MSNPIETLRAGVDKLADRDKSFATSLLAQFEERGSLSDKQWYWVQTLSLRADKPAPSVGISLPGISGLMRKACESMKRVRITMRGFSVRSSRYADTFYVCSGETYIGKIQPDASFVPARDYAAVKALDACRSELLALDADPMHAATTYGHETGSCCFCARELTDARSVHVGYGPICASRFGLPWGETKEAEKVLAEQLD